MGLRERYLLSVSVALLLLLSMLGVSAQIRQETGSRYSQVLNLPANTWVARPVPNFPASPGPGYSKHVRLTYDSDRHLIYLWGGDYCVSNPVDGVRCASHEEFWSYDVAQDKWELLLDQIAANAPGFPRGRCVPGFTYDPKRKVVWMMNGQERYQGYHPNLQSGGLWAFDPALRIWSREGTDAVGESTKVGLMSAFMMAYDRVNDALFVPGRIDHTVLFTLNNVALRKGRVADNWSSTPFPVSDPYLGDGYNNVYAVDTKRNRVIMYLAQRGETWAYDFATKGSTLLKQQKLLPHANFTMVYDSANDIVALWGGGEAFDPSLNDLWVFDFNKNAWSKPLLGGTPPAIGLHAQIAYDAQNNAIVLYGEQIFLVRLDLRKQSESKPSYYPGR